MKKQFKDSRAGLIVALGVLLTALWLVIAYGAYEESKREKYLVNVKPGAVSYGTHSTAVVPMVSVPMHHSSVPMISGSAVRNYAHYGHATMPSASYSGGGYRLHTTSSATVHTIGSGGGGGSVGGGGGSSSGRGISYSGVSYSVPTLALATPSYGNPESAVSQYNRVIRRAKPTYDGQVGDEVVDDEDEHIIWTWSEEAEDWVSTTPIGTKKYDPILGYMVEWNGSEWVKVENQADPSPIGDAPWHWMLMLAIGYVVIKKRSVIGKLKFNAI